jgi:nicotinate-nucleotide adenylyltransferase
LKTSPQHIALYGGTFDPIHLGHLIQACEVAHTFRLQKLIFIPCRISPHKNKAPSAPDNFRWLMICRAIAPYAPTLQADKLELTRPTPSYTYDTVIHFRQQYPTARLYWLLGEDQLPLLHTWHRYEDLIKLVTFILLPRPDSNGKSTRHTFLTHYKKATFLPWPSSPRTLQISSTEIRQRIHKKKPYSHLVPTSTYRIIQKHHLYG